VTDSSYLLRQPEMLAEVLDLTGAHIVVLDARETIIQFNARCQSTTGFEAKDMLGRQFIDAVIATDHAARIRAILDRSKDGEPASDDCLWRAQNDRNVYMHCTLTTLRDEHGGVAGIVCTAVDISEKKRIEMTLLDRENRLRAILDTAVDGIFTIDEHGTIESMNHAAERIFGYKRDELVGRNVSSLMTDADSGQHDRYIERYLAGGEARIIGIGREVTGRRKDGSTFPMDLAVSEVRIGGQRGFTGIVRDVTERRKAQEEAHLKLNEHAHAARIAALGEMASGIAHELNQPLTAIVSFADAGKRILVKNPDKTQIVADALNQIAEQGERAGRIIRRLRDFVHKGRIERAPVAIIDLIDNAISLADHDLRMHDVQTIKTIAQPLPTVHVDRVQIEQVIINLIRNAVDSMANSTQRILTITCQRERNDCVELSVSDTGTGFAHEDKGKLFEAFFTTKRMGTGLGLSISQSIINAHGGSLTGDNNPHGGATFRFTLPVT